MWPVTAAPLFALTVEQMTTVHDYLKARDLLRLIVDPIDVRCFGPGWVATVCESDLDMPVGSGETAQKAVDELVDMLEVANDRR